MAEFISPAVESVSFLGLRLSFGEDVVVDGTPSLWLSFIGSTTVVSGSWREQVAKYEQC